MVTEQMAKNRRQTFAICHFIITKLHGTDTSIPIDLWENQVLERVCDSPSITQLLVVKEVMWSLSSHYYYYFWAQAKVKWSCETHKEWLSLPFPTIKNTQVYLSGFVELKVVLAKRKGKKWLNSEGWSIDWHDENSKNPTLIRPWEFGAQ